MHISGIATGSGVAAICLAIAAVLWTRKRAPRAVLWLALIAGFGLGGALGGLLSNAGEFIGRAASDITAKVVGVAVPGALLAGVLTWLCVDLKSRRPSRIAPFLALLFPVLLSVTGGVMTGVGGWLGELGSGVNSALTYLFTRDGA